MRGRVYSARWYIKYLDYTRSGVAWWHFLRTKITRWFGFLTPFEIAPTRVYYRELLVHSLEKEVIREGEGVCEGQNLEAEQR